MSGTAADPGPFETFNITVSPFAAFRGPPGVWATTTFAGFFENTFCVAPARPTCRNPPTAPGGAPRSAARAGPRGLDLPGRRGGAGGRVSAGAGWWELWAGPVASWVHDAGCSC